MYAYIVWQVCRNYMPKEVKEMSFMKSFWADRELNLLLSAEYVHLLQLLNRPLSLGQCS